MKLFVDANVVLDVLLRRAEFVAASQRVLSLCATRRHEGGISALSVCNLMYVLRRYLSLAEARDRMRRIVEWLPMIPIGSSDVALALNEEHPDFEDAVQANCAAQWGAELIVTRDPKGFSHATVPVLSPDEFLEQNIGKGTANL